MNDDAVREAVYGSLTAEFATAASGRPATVPLTPFYDRAREVIVVTAAPAFAGKAERAAAEPRVSLLLHGDAGPASDESGSSSDRRRSEGGRLHVTGRATVRDTDLEANSAVVERLLRVEDVTWRNFHDVIDFTEVQSLIAPDPILEDVPGNLDAFDPDDPRIDAEALEVARDGAVDVDAYPWKVLTYEGLAERHYSLVKPQYRGFVSRIAQSDLERISRYMFDDARYDSVEEAIADVEYARGWDRMREVRESHNDVTFLDEFLTQEFVDEHNYFTYEYTHSSGDFRATSTAAEDVKKKLMLQFTNFGKPTITVEDGNYRNRNELLLTHQYNGVVLDIGQARETLKRVFELWGRPVNLLTIDKQFDEHDVEVARRRDREPEPEEVGRRIRYDGEEVTIQEVDWSEVEHLDADDIDYDTKPEEWVS